MLCFNCSNSSAKLEVSDSCKAGFHSASQDSSHSCKAGFHSASQDSSQLPSFLYVMVLTKDGNHFSNEIMYTNGSTASFPCAEIP
jgi:hypothetical protein